MKTLVVFLWAVGFSILGCDDRPPPNVAAAHSQLRVATDVYWALGKNGYIATKEKPHPSRHGCKSTEYLAQKNEARFRISVFHCGEAEQAAALVEHPKTRRIDSLLRNHGEGGVIQRGPLKIIVRMTQGQKTDAQGLMHFLGNL